jgi:colanic acid/amylovoran biosynthesis glycosyltransferase
MRIGLVLPKVPAYSESFFRNKIIGLQQNGIEVIVFASGKKNEFNLCPLHLQPPVSNLFPFAWIWTIISFLQALFKRPILMLKYFLFEQKQQGSFFSAFKTVILNTHILQYHLDWIHYGYGTMALGRENLAKVMGARMAVSLRGYDIAIYPLKYPNCYSQVWSRIDKLHVISDYVYKLAAIHGLPCYIPFCKITPAIDRDHFHKNILFQEFGNNKVNILTVARLSWIKGIDYTLEALALLKKRSFDFQYTVIGEGIELDRLVYTAYQLGIIDKVNFVGRQNSQSVKSALEHTDIYIQYSISEGFCNSVLEAQSMGVLCVVSDAEGLQENISHGETGWVVPRRDPEALANEIIHIIGLSLNDRNCIREAAVNRVKNNFDLEHQKMQFFDFYQN